MRRRCCTVRKMESRFDFEELSRRCCTVRMMASRVDFEELSPEKLCSFLQQQMPKLSEDILTKILEHKIDGEVFLGLNDEYLREIAPLLGDRMKLRRVLAATLAEVSVSFTVCVLYTLKIFSLLHIYIYMYVCMYVCMLTHMISYYIYIYTLALVNSLSTSNYFNVLIAVRFKREEHSYSIHNFQEFCSFQPCP